MEKIWRWIVLSIAAVAGEVFFRVFNRLEVEGKPERFCGPTIFYANHRNFTDPLVILFGCLLRPWSVLTGRAPIVWTIAWAGNFRSWQRLLVKPARLILHEPGLFMGNTAEVVAAVGAALKRGELILIFPEGRRHRGHSPDDLAAFRRGLASLVRNCEAALVPVAVVGTDALMPEGLYLPRIGRKVKVVFGDAVPNAAVWDGKGTREITAHLEERMKNLLRAAH